MTIEDDRDAPVDGDRCQGISEGKNHGIQPLMTDQLAGKEDTQRILAYAESIAKESRKALTLEFNQKHKGIPFNTVPKILQDSLLAWFARRDKNVRVTPGTVNSSKPGELRAVFNGEAKKVQFKIHADATFTMTGESGESPCYLKELNVSVSRDR